MIIRFSRARSYVKATCRAYSSVTSEVPYEKKIKDQSSEHVSDIPSTADVVVIGGGSLGCHTLYQLTKLGVKNVVLLERDRLTSGTTWHTAGLLWRLRPNDIDIYLQNYTRHLVKDVLPKESDMESCWSENGGLFIASSKERLDEYKRMTTLGKVFGIESHVLSPEETKKLFPLMNTSDVYGATFSPGDGIIDPAGLCTALTRVAKKSGAKVVEQCPVTGIRVEKDDFGTKRVRAVDTPMGTIKTDCIVSCTGAWSAQFGKMAGVRVPLLPMKHAYIVTNHIEGLQNLPNVRDHDSKFYVKVQGGSFHMGGYEPNPIMLDQGVPDDFSFGLYDLDWNVFSSHIEKAVHRIPALGEAGIKSTVCGPESFTPDHKPLMGEDVEVRGFFHGVGFNSGGMMLGGGAGKILAGWVVNGRPEIDMFSYDIRRFSRQQASSSEWLRERSHESYAKHYSIAYLQDQPRGGRNLRKDALHEEMKKAGCVFQERHGWERPGWFNKEGPVPVVEEYDYYGNYGYEPAKNDLYADILEKEYSFDFPQNHGEIGEECQVCRNKVGLINMSYFGKFYLVGPDAQKAANYIFSANMNKPEGSVTYTCMLNKNGGVEADLTVSVIEPGDESPCEPSFQGRGFYLATSGAAAMQNYSHVKTVIQDMKFDAQLIDHSNDMCLLSIQGPNSRSLLQELTDQSLTETDFPIYTNRIIKIAGEKVRAMRVSFIGELGWELHIPNRTSVHIYRKLMETGYKYGLRNVGYRAMDSLSIEKGYRHWHADLRMDDTPLEAGMAFTCKLKENTDFLGRSALEKQKKEGIRKRLVCFTIDENIPLWGMEGIYRNGQPVGHIRVAEYGFSIGKSLGWGYVRNSDGGPVTIDYLTQGTYELERMDQKIPAKIFVKTLFDPEGKRLKGQYE